MRHQRENWTVAIIGVFALAAIMLYAADQAEKERKAPRETRLERSVRLCETKGGVPILNWNESQLTDCKL